MLCPNCGTDNSVGLVFCAGCGMILPAEDDGFEAAVGSRLGLETLRDIDLQGVTFWPAETVFVPGDLEEPDSPVFEDASADDEFERSLSGVKIEDLADDQAEEPIFAVDPIPPTEPRAYEAAAKRDVEVAPELPPDVPQATIPIGTGWVTQNIESDRPREQVSQVRRPSLLFRAVLAASFAGLFFAAGLTTQRYYLRSQSLTPATVVEPAPTPNPWPPSPPTGMVYVPGGEFTMGADDGEALSRPAHTVAVAPFFIDATEVTNEQYGDFIKATRHDPPRRWPGGNLPIGEEKLPVTGVTWYDAAEYAAWAGKRLPTEAEWELAARGSDGRKYPWGNEWDPRAANIDAKERGVRVVGQGAASPYGALDMAGNAWEWTSSDARPYPGGREFRWSRLRLKIIRGGNWQSGSVTAAATFRGFYGAAGERTYDGTSFRCVKDLPREVGGN